MRSTREVAARKGIAPEDIMMSSRERGVAPPGEGAPRGRRMPLRRGMRGTPPTETLPPASTGAPPAHAGAAHGSPAVPHAQSPSAAADFDAPPKAWSPPAPAVAPVATPVVAWSDIQALAFGYDALQIAGSLDRAIALADRVRAEYGIHGGFSASPRELAACMAFETRTCLHCGVTPEGDDLRYLSALYMVVFSHKP